MTISDIQRKLDFYNRPLADTERSWIKTRGMVIYENDFLKVIRVDSSNKWVAEDEMEKMWSIIFSAKKDFTRLPTYRALQTIINVSVTPVTRGSLKGNYGIRIYGMKRDPDAAIIKSILDFIFSK